MAIVAIQKKACVLSQIKIINKIMGWALMKNKVMAAALNNLKLKQTVKKGCEPLSIQYVYI